MSEPLVSVKMITYNHGPYIAQAIEGVLQQKTNFRFELVIGEDCSTDRTREIVFKCEKKYPDVIRVITSDTNVGAKKNSYRTDKACRGRYIAFCEGDDYWTDPYKLQKQVDFLENHQDYGMVHGDAGELIQDSRNFYESKRIDSKQTPSGYIYEQLLVKNFIYTLTVVVRKQVYLSAISELDLIDKRWRMGDYPLWLEIAKHHNIHYIDQRLGVYRRLAESASHSKDTYRNFLFDQDSFEIQWYFIKKYGAMPKTIETIKRQYNETISKYAFYLNDKTIMEASDLFKDVGTSLKFRCYYLGLKYRPFRLVLKTYLKLTNKEQYYRPGLSCSRHESNLSKKVEI